MLGQIGVDTHTAIVLGENGTPQGSELLRVPAGYLEGVMLDQGVKAASPRARPAGLGTISIGVAWRQDRLAKVGRGTRVSWEAGRGGVPTEPHPGTGRGALISPGLVVLLDPVALWLKGEPTPPSATARLPADSSVLCQ